MDFYTILINYWQYIVSGFVSACFLVVNIIQAIRSHDKSKLKDAICRIPEIIRIVEQFAANQGFEGFFGSTTTTIDKGTYKKSMAESLLITEFGSRFVKKYISVFDDAIEDILNTPQKKGGSDGISKENEER